MVDRLMTSLTMRASTHFGAALVLALALSTGCGPTARPASMSVLQTRAELELSCPSTRLVIHHLDARTKIVAGCGRHGVYVESCDVRGRGHGRCAWMLQTASPPQVAPSPRCPEPLAISCPPQPCVEPAAGQLPVVKPRHDW
jgi:hypothetical protein